jgi:hypothetical protein
LAAIGIGAGAARAARPALVGVIAVEALRRALGAGRVDLAAVVSRALVGVAEGIVGGGDRLLLVFCHALAGIEVRVMFLGELVVGLANVLVAGVLRDAENLIGVQCHPVVPSSQFGKRAVCPRAISLGKMSGWAALFKF